MERYNKYLVLKNEDIAKHLSDEKQLKLDALVTNIRVGRLKDGKRDQEYVVVAADWPMYETVWGLIEAFVDNKPNEMDQLRARVAELEAQLLREEHTRTAVEDLLHKQTAAVTTLEEQLANHKRLLLLAKGALEFFWRDVSMNEYAFEKLEEALSAINDSKLVEGLVLCDADANYLMEEVTENGKRTFTVYRAKEN